MLGGYGKPLAITMSAMTLPIFLSVFLLIAYPRYGLYFLTAGIGGTVFLLMMLEQYKHSKFQGKRAIALTRRMHGAVDDLVYIVYGFKKDLPKEEGKYVSVFQDAITKSWYMLFSDHPLSDLNYNEDTIPAGAFFVNMPVAYVEGAQLMVVKRTVFDLAGGEAGLIAKLMGKLKATEEDGKRAVVEVPQIYVYGTSATAERIFAGQPLDSPPPTPEALKSAYANFVTVDPDYSELQAKCIAYEKEREKLKKVVDSFSDTIVEYGDINLVESKIHISKKWLIVFGLVAIAAVIAFYTAKGMGWI